MGRFADGPVLGPLEDVCRRIGHTIGGVLDEHNAAHPHSPRVGFGLFMFTFGEPDDPDQWMTWLSNAERDTMLDAMEEFLAKNGRPR